MDGEGEGAVEDEASADAVEPMDPRRERLMKLIALGVSFVLCFLALEVVARVTWHSPLHVPREAVRTPGIFSYRLKVNHDADLERADGGTFHVHTNERGFRGPLVSAMADEPLRILSLGDSFTFGWGVDFEQQCVARFVEAYRQAHADRRVGTANVSCPGWDPKDYFFAYQTEAGDKKPDLVVLGVFSGNDVMPPDAPRFDDHRKAPSIEELPSPPQPLFRSVDWVRAQLSGSLFIAKLRAKHGKPAAFALYDPDLEKQKKTWDTTFHYLEQVDRAVRADGGKLVVVLYPTPMQVNTPGALDEAGYDHAAPEKVVGAFCKDKGIELVTLLDDLKAAAREKQDLYFVKDRHLTVHGNEVATLALTKKLAPIVDKLWDERVRKPKSAP